MGSLILPASGLVSLDASPVIYSVEKHPTYWPILQPIWKSAKANQLELVSSDLTLMEVLIGPLKSGDHNLASSYERLFRQARTRLLPITHSILRRAAQLRANSKLRTPDAVHAATAEDVGCSLFVTNDAGFRGISALSLVILDDLLPP